MFNFIFGTISKDIKPHTQRLCISDKCSLGNVFYIDEALPLITLFSFSVYSNIDFPGIIEEE